MESLELTETFPVKPEIIYNAWIDSKIHSDFTGTLAEINPVVNGKFTAWDDYISGTNIKLIPGEKIVQYWRTSEFPDKSPDSILELTFAKVKSGTKLTLRQTNIPDGQADNYKQGWIDFYFEPLKNYFSK